LCASQYASLADKLHTRIRCKLNARYQGTDGQVCLQESQSLRAIDEASNLMTPGLHDAADDPLDRSAWIDKRDTHNSFPQSSFRMAPRR
jgi:hypothetical protein